MAALDDDTKFDRWMHDFERKQKLESAQAKRGGGGGVSISKEQYLAKHAKVHGGT